MAGFREQMAAVPKQFNKTLVLSVLLICVSQWNFGFDQTAFSIGQSTDSFQHQFGTKLDAETGMRSIDTKHLSIFNGVPYVGFAAGLVAGSEISERYGRRMVMFVMSVFAIACAAVVISSKSFGQILAGRILNYAYVGMELAVVPVFQAEIVPRQVRGLVVETYQLMLFLGGLVMSLICYGTVNSFNDNRQWVIPFGLFFIVPVFISVFIWFIPESPRWLLAHDRPEEAYAALHRLRDGRFSEEEIQSELDATRVMLEAEKEQGSFMDLWKGTNLRRTLITCGVNFWLQITGNTFANKYGTIFIKSIGGLDPFVMTIVNKLVSLLGVVVSMALVDRAGRRPMLFFGGLIQAAALFTMGGLGSSTNQTLGQKQGIISMLSVFGFGFCSGWAPVSHILSSELGSARMRDATYRVASVINIGVSCMTTLVTPYLIDTDYANLHSKVGFIYGGAAIGATIFAYFCVPECKNKTLEEIDKLFIDGTPIRKFQSVDVAVQDLEFRDVEDKQGAKVRIRDQ